MMNNKIGKKIMKLRLKMNLSQRQLAERVGVSVSAIAMYEANERVPRDEVKVRLAHFFDTSVQSLFF
ncbi:helix-turn-helix transcriptional regulator [Veillonella sp. VA137]|uniref:helix-turn-helix transcriptional regulator n=1 Tax=Veillonella sp. VA137 TaxID=741828 RepID=UPI00197E4E6F|nr:helix-turn-helix transcriptional regulator [Veillonella sp. VA137]